MIKNKTVFTSRETKELMQKRKQNRLRIFSFFPNDKGDCVCQKEVLNLKIELRKKSEAHREEYKEKMKFFECPRDKSGMKRYKISCNICGETQGYVWATDDKLTDWCDFHYVNWTDGNKWHGCLTPNVSPIDQRLTFECACGNDTRDFRANMTLPYKIAERIERDNSVGRDYGLANSKFSVTITTRRGKI